VYFVPVAYKELPEKQFLEEERRGKQKYLFIPQIQKNQKSVFKEREDRQVFNERKALIHDIQTKIVLASIDFFKKPDVLQTVKKIFLVEDQLKKYKNIKQLLIRLFLPDDYLLDDADIFQEIEKLHFEKKAQISDIFKKNRQQIIDVFGDVVQNKQDKD